VLRPLERLLARGERHVLVVEADEVADQEQEAVRTDLKKEIKNVKSSFR
jgi:hypothetical protein